MFSVIIPLYNKAPYIQRAIDSVLNQSFSEYEIIVVNDGSTDGGGELVRQKYGEQVILLNQRNQGVSLARNKGIEKAKYNWIAFLDGDDYWHPNYLQLIAEAIQEQKNVGLIGAYYTFDKLPNKVEKPNLIEIQDYFSRAIHNTLFTSSSTVIRKDFFENQEGFKPHLKIGEDLDVWFRAIAFFEKTFLIEAPLVHYDLEASASKKIEKKLTQSILLEILRVDYFGSSKIPVYWNQFKVKFILFNLFEYFQLKSNKLLIRELQQASGLKYPLVSIIYFFPYSLMKVVFKLGFLKKLFRNYMKFCFRYIYLK
jgi:Glycosyltransferases involved in cell wall biogenesis